MQPLPEDILRTYTGSSHPTEMAVMMAYAESVGMSPLEFCRKCRVYGEITPENVVNTALGLGTKLDYWFYEVWFQSMAGSSISENAVVEAADIA